MSADILDELELMRFTRIDPIRENAILKRAKDEIVRLRGEVERALAYLHPHLDAGTFAAPDWAIQLASILTGGDGCETPAPAMPNGVEDIDWPFTYIVPDSRHEYVPKHHAERKIRDALRAADNRDAAGVAAIRAEEYTRGRCDGWEAARSTPAAVPAGEAVAWRFYVEDHPDLKPYWTGWGVDEWFRDQMVKRGCRAEYAHPPAATPPAPVQAAPQEGEAMDRGPWRRKGARFYSDDFTHDVSLVVGGDFGSDEAEDRYLDWLLSVLNGPAGAALQHRGDSQEVGHG